jgi:hypothetical protein
MYSTDEFAALEIMRRERAALAKQEVEYWLAEARTFATVKATSAVPPGSRHLVMCHTPITDMRIWCPSIVMEC